MKIGFGFIAQIAMKKRDLYIALHLGFNPLLRVGNMKFF